MKQVRDLLMDCRIELRTLVRDFHKSELCKRIDDARDVLLHGPAAVAGPVSADGADRIAQAWQASAEDLRLTAPAIYELLAKKVAQRLAALPAVATEPAITSVADVGADSPPDSKAASTSASTDSVETVSSSTIPGPVDVDAHIPNEEVLTAIAANKRRFTEAQREWCVGEAMVRSGFNIDPEEFMARGDSEMARYILETVEN